MSVPGWYPLALLTAAAFRSFKLAADDTILDRPRGWAIRRLPDTLELFLLCPWCSGFWISVAWWGGYQLSPHWATVAAVPLAISALVGLTARLLDT